MANPRISATIRRQVALRAVSRCEYCLSPSDCSNSPFSIEHIIPRAQGGSDEETNLAWSCMGCNDHKYTATTAIDPVSGEVVDLFHPRLHRWSDHFSWTADFTHMVGHSAIGRATVMKLKLNRLALVKLRRILYLAGEHPPA